MSTDPLPPAPWSAARPRRGTAPKPPITRDVIVATALRLLDAEGLEGVSMRRVAEGLQTGPASLYQHVANKDELLELLLDEVLAEVVVPASDPDDWQTPLKELLRSLRSVLVAHQDIAYVTLGRIPTGPNALTISEGILGIMRTGGVPPDVAAYGVDTLALYVGAVAYEESIWARQVDTPEKASAYVQEVHDYFAALPPDRFPTLVELAGRLTRIDDAEDPRFEFSLDVLVRGIAARAADEH